MRYFLIFVLIITSNKIVAQQLITGQVLDNISKLPIENAIVSYGNRVSITSYTGKFSFVRDTSTKFISIKKLGYINQEVSLSNRFKEVVILLKASEINLQEITIYPKRDYLKDSIQLRKDFAKVFAYKELTIKDVIVKKGLRYKTPGSNLVSNSTSSIFSVDVLKIAGLLAKNKSSVSKLKKAQLKDEETKYIDHRFDVEKIVSLTKLEGDSLQKFITKYRPSAAEIKKMNDYQLLSYIKKSFLEFTKQNND
ncbi:carboxypeptidase-like regulatory domain-containing protein [Pedobacter sp. Leaf170]|uniref:carboxypeptidase-like regulatory domain-containing protein n=1 Tax=Pedobacter sp. Leaf170 TaxID=2876558 RepID=UPI001E3778C4|nr:carboxypeptidase-like regulatory domain-containing protein [Pedobacter sp. Leaf170]